MKLLLVAVSIIFAFCIYSCCVAGGKEDERNGLK